MATRYGSKSGRVTCQVVSSLGHPGTNLERGMPMKHQQIASQIIEDLINGRIGFSYRLKFNTII
ncbi:TPA: hypothetical protein ACRNRF_004574 [Pseudomonas aeruginosa]